MDKKISVITLPDDMKLCGYKGEYVFDKIISAKDYYEKLMLEIWVEKYVKQAKVIYDIGANLGNHTVYFASYVSEAEIYAFEPLPENFQLLQKNVEENGLKKVKLYQAACGDNKRKATMSLRMKENNGTAKIDKEDTKGQAVEILALDDMELPSPDFIKIDVEGFELHVLKGMRNILKSSEPTLWIEVDTENGKNVYEFLKNMGYYPIEMNLEQDNNVVFSKKGIKDSDSKIFQDLLYKAEAKRNDREIIRKKTSQYEYEQKKAESLKKDLEKEVSKYEYEQKKAESLKKSLEEQVSKYEYEQKKAESLKIDLEKQTSKYEYEQKKAESLKKDLEKQTSKYEYEQKKAESLKKSLEEQVSKYEYEQKKAGGLKKDLEKQIFLSEEQQKRAEKLEEQLNEKIYEYKKELEQVKQLEEEKEFQRKQTDYFEERLKKKASQFLYEQRKAEELKRKCNEYEARLSLYQKSKLFRLMLWKWKISSKTRFYLKKAIYTFGNRVYTKLLPYPKLRSFCSKVNRKLKLFKNPQAVVSYHRKKEENINQSTKKRNMNTRLKKPLEMNVAIIADEFTYNSFRYECNIFPLNPDNWKKILEEKEIDLFFCESAWAGIDPIKRPWRGQIYGSINFKKENRGVLLEILAYCKENNIPTIFWNKEDPTHYPDKVHNFVDTAVKFDHIFTTDADCVEKYKKDYGHKSVHLLMFATQPKLFNPIEEFQRTEEIIFAGSWYQQHPARCEEMGGILDNIIASKYPLKIYNRHSETDDPNHIFPERFQEYLHPSLPHDQMKTAYKSSKYALNINTVTHSSSMFARRVFELMSSHTLVVSNYSKGMEELFGDRIVFIDGTHEIVIEQEEEKREKALYNVLAHHTYKQRFHQILKDINLSFIEEDDDITFLFEIRNEESAKNAYKKLQEIDYGNKKGIFYIKKECSEVELRHIVTIYNGFLVNVISEDYCCKYEDVLSIDTKYFIIADGNLSNDFVRKAVLHFEYLENTIGITEGKNKFTFIENEKINNVLFSKNMFYEVKKTYSGIEDMTFKIYQC